MDKNAIEQVNKLRNWVQQEFGVTSGSDLVLISNLLTTAILSTDITTLIKTFSRSQTNRLALRRLQSAFRLLKKANLMKYKEE